MLSASALLLAASLVSGECRPCAGPVELVPWRCGGAAERYDPQPGDLIVFRHRNVAQNVLYTVFLSGGATHSAIVVAHPGDGRPVLLEAPGSRDPVVLSDVLERVRSFKGKVWVRRRAVPLTPAQSAQLTDFAAAQVGKGFDTLGLIGPPVCHPVRRRPGRCLSWEDLNPPRWFCSKLNVAAGVAAGVLDPCIVRPSTTDPSDFLSDRRLVLAPDWERPRLVVGKETRWSR